MRLWKRIQRQRKNIYIDSEKIQWKKIDRGKYSTVKNLDSGKQNRYIGKKIYSKKKTGKNKYIYSGKHRDSGKNRY